MTIVSIGSLNARVLLVLCLSSVACDPAKYAAIQVAPQSTQGDSAARAALALVARIAERHGLAVYPTLDAKGHNPQGWAECFAKPYLFLCAKLRGREAQLELVEHKTAGFTTAGNSLRRELMDSLRAHFGPQRVRECKWRAASDPTQAGCPPLIVADTPRS